MIARTRAGRALAVSLAVAVALSAAPAARAAPTTHLVDRGAVARALADHQAERLAQVRSVQAALDTPAAREQARAMGADPARLRALVPHLSDAELADLGRRAEGLKDVTAGHSTNDGLVIVGLVLLVAGLVVLAALAYDDYYYDDSCYCY